MAKILSKINGNKKHILTATQVATLLTIATLLWRLFVALQPIAADAIEAKTRSIDNYHKIGGQIERHDTYVHNAKVFAKEDEIVANERFMAVESKAHNNELGLTQIQIVHKNISQAIKEFGGEQKKMSANVQSLVTDVAVIKKQVDNLERVE